MKTDRVLSAPAPEDNSDWRTDTPIDRGQADTSESANADTASEEGLLDPDSNDTEEVNEEPGVPPGDNGLPTDPPPNDIELSMVADGEQPPQGSGLRLIWPPS